MPHLPHARVSEILSLLTTYSGFIAVSISSIVWSALSLEKGQSPVCISDCMFRHQVSLYRGDNSVYLRSFWELQKQEMAKGQNRPIYQHSTTADILLLLDHSAMLTFPLWFLGFSDLSYRVWSTLKVYISIFTAAGIKKWNLKVQKCWMFFRQKNRRMSDLELRRVLHCIPLGTA